MSFVQGLICSTDAQFGDALSTTTGFGLTTKGDMIRICAQKAPASNAAGNAGEICIGTTGGVTYIHYCIASTNWGRIAFTTGY